MGKQERSNTRGREGNDNRVKKSFNKPSRDSNRDSDRNRLGNRQKGSK